MLQLMLLRMPAVWTKKFRHRLCSLLRLPGILPDTLGLVCCELSLELEKWSRSSSSQTWSTSVMTTSSPAGAVLGLSVGCLMESWVGEMELALLLQTLSF